jgi:predicted double-glycine peptidase
MTQENPEPPIAQRSSWTPVFGQRSGAFPVLVALLLLGLGCSTVHRELAVPNVRQATDYTCGVAALQAVLAYYGMQTREDLLAREVGADPNKGVNPSAIVRAARARGLTAEMRQGMTIREIAEIVHAGSPVLVALQAWSAKPRSRYREDWDNGHYAIIVAVDQDTVVFEDPSVLGSRAVLSRREFQDRWHDTDGTRSYVRMGIVFSGRTPAPPLARVPME